MEPSEEIKQELERLRKENAELKKQLQPSASVATSKPAPEQLPILGADFDAIAEASTSQETQAVTSKSPIQQKIVLFRSLFRGREDVYAERWESGYSGKTGYSPACENKWEALKDKKKQRKYFSLTDQIIQDHLSGEKTIGVYSLLGNSRCYFLACDFDGTGWKLDAVAYLNSCGQYGVPAYLERSRSGDGAHVWIFFSESVKAEQARQLGMRLLRQVMEVRAEMDLASYDRFFPSQDFTPKGGFGNLIALPLQKHCREKGNTEFLDSSDPDLKPWPDQWAFLSQVKRIAPPELTRILLKVPLISLGVGTLRAPSKIIREKFPAPAKISGVLGSVLSIEKSGIPPWLLSQIKHLASLWNPTFFERQRKRFSTYGIPPLIRCYEEDMSHLHLPRGTQDEIADVFKVAGSELILEDHRPTFAPLNFEFQGELTDIQRHAMDVVLADDIGVLVAPPGAGKTVMGCYAMAQRNVPTLVLSHRKPILEQWRRQLMHFLKLKSSDIGQVGGGRHRQTGIVDLGMLQSLEGNDVAASEEFFSNYGLVVIDECHHIPAVTFESSMKRVTARYILGLTATPQRSDGLHDIILMQCGPLRYRMAVEDSGIPRQLIVRETPLPSIPLETHISEVFKTMARDEGRNQLILEDVVQALEKGRKCLVLSHLKEHCHSLVDGLTQKGKSPYLLSGAIGKKQRTAIIDEIKALPAEEELLIIATGQYLGEGFDCPPVDTLFLAFPVAFKGKLVQYVGRILRHHRGKESVIVYDYVDRQVPVLSHMFSRRSAAYKSMKFSLDGEARGGVGR
jgi:superfamily II DNA or RNA helicase